MSNMLTSYNYKKYLFKDIFIRFCDEFINSIIENGSEFSNLEGFMYWTLGELQNQQASCSIYIEDDKYVIETDWMWFYLDVTNTKIIKQKDDTYFILVGGCNEVK